MTGLRSQLRRVFDIRAGEGRDVAVAFATLFSFMAGHGLLETARDALFLSRLPPERLPWVYIAMATVGVGAVRLMARFRAPRGGRRLAITLAFIAAVTGLVALTLARSSASFAPYAVYVWVGIAASAATVELWQLLGDRFTVGQAKRLFGLVGAGGVIGIAAGSAFAATLSARLQPTALLLAGAASIATAASIPLWLGPGASVASPRREASGPLEAYRVVRDEPHARRLLFLVAMTTITLTTLDFLFKSRVAASIPHARLGVFFGEYYACMNAIGLMVQLFLTPWMLRRFGAKGLSLLPCAVLGGAAAFAMFPFLGVVLAVKAVDGALRYTLQQTGFEVLFLPLPDSSRRALKRLVEFVGQRGAQAVASAGILLTVALGAGPRSLAVAIAVMSVLWLVGLHGVTRRYLELFRLQLRTGAIDAATHLPELDLAALEVLLVSLSSADAREAIAALGLLEQQGKVHLVPPLIVYHPARAVALRALDTFARHRRLDVLPLLDALIAYGDPQRRAAALRVRHALAPGLDDLEHGDRTDAATSAAALVAAAARAEDPLPILDHASRIARGPDAVAKTELARAIAEDADPRWIPVLEALATTQDVDVLEAVTEAARKLKRVELAPALVAMLATRGLRDSARGALAAMGDDVLPALSRALQDEATPIEVKRHVPRSVSRLQSPAAARVLVERLAKEHDGMTRYKILRALGGMRAADARLGLDTERLRIVASSTLERIVELLWFRVSIAARGPARSARRALLLGLLEEKQRRATERLFRLLDLLDGVEDYHLLYDGIRRGATKARAAAREVLANAIASDLRETVLVLLDEIADADKLMRLRESHPDVEEPATIERMAADRSGAVRQLVAYYSAEIGAAPREVADATG